jgi:hypothetical protein
VSDVLTLHAHFLHGLRSQQGSDVGSDRPIKTRNDDGISSLEKSVNKHDVDGGSMTLNNLHFKDRALKDVSLSKLLTFSGLTHRNQVGDQITQTFACDGRGRYKTESVLNRLVEPVQLHVKGTLVKGESRLGELILKML